MFSLRSVIEDFHTNGGRFNDENVWIKGRLTGMNEGEYLTWQQYWVCVFSLLDMIWLSSQRTLIYFEVVTLDDDPISRQQVTCKPPHSQSLQQNKVKRKILLYSLPSVGPGTDPGIQAVRPQVTFFPAV